MDNYSAEDLALEMRSFIKVDGNVILHARRSKVNYGNHSDFRTLVEAWRDGMYDEDPNIVIQELKSLIYKNKPYGKTIKK